MCLDLKKKSSRVISPWFSLQLLQLNSNEKILIWVSIIIIAMAKCKVPELLLLVANVGKIDL